MERWTGAFGLIRRREYTELLAKIEGPLPFDFSTAGSSLKDFVAAAWTTDQEPNLVIDFPSRTQEYVTAFFSGYSKFRHSLDCSRASNHRGAQTWGLVESYHSTLLGARSIAAALGVCVFTIGGRTVIVDLFPESGTVDHGKKFAKAHKGIDNPIRIMAPSRDKFLEQSKLWNLIERLFNLKSFASSGEEILQLALIQSLKRKPWSERHDILYDLTAWRWPEDIALRPLNVSDLTTLFMATDQDVIEFNEFVDQIYDLNEHYAADFTPKVLANSVKLPSSSSGMNTPGVVI